MGGVAIVLLDEVETLAVSRQKLSFDANPADVHRATDALLSGMDRLTRSMLQPRCAAIMRQKKSAMLRSGPSPSLLGAAPFYGQNLRR